VEQDCIEPMIEQPRRRLADDRPHCDGPRAALKLEPVVARAIAGANDARGDDHCSERVADRIEPALAHRHRLDDRDAEFFRELDRIEFEPVAPGQVDHVESDNGRQAEVDELKGKAQMIVEVGRVDHDQQRVR